MYVYKILFLISLGAYEGKNKQLKYDLWMIHNEIV